MVAGVYGHSLPTSEDKLDSRLYSSCRSARGVSRCGFDNDRYQRSPIEGTGGLLRSAMREMRRSRRCTCLIEITVWLWWYGGSIKFLRLRRLDLAFSSTHPCRAHWMRLHLDVFGRGLYLFDLLQLTAGFAEISHKSAQMGDT
jgi:hypothetical protein